jgi:hypothetical protein
MSELTPCCFCVLAGLRKQAARAGMQVTVQPATANGFGFPKCVDVIVHPPDETPDCEKHFAAWLGEVSDHCVC